MQDPSIAVARCDCNTSLTHHFQPGGSASRVMKLVSGCTQNVSLQHPSQQQGESCGAAEVCTCGRGIGGRHHVGELFSALLLPSSLGG